MVKTCPFTRDFCSKSCALATIHGECMIVAGAQLTEDNNKKLDAILSLLKRIH